MKTSIKFEKCIINEDDEDETHKRCQKYIVKNAALIGPLKCKRYGYTKVT